jgi:pimeloyl-ACP methyl ester carboxylesterase
MGGLIAMQLALTSPRRVKSLSLMCTFPDGRSGARLTRDTVLAGVRSRIRTRTMRRNAVMELILSDAGRTRSNRDELAKDLAGRANDGRERREGSDRAPVIRTNAR